MTDYGHELLFGSFITPAAGHPEHVVALAQLSEQAGLDLVTFQDHPYLPALLDTWTLMSYVAAATATVRLAANVINLPLRQPVVLARSAASLDLLSGGRVELGLGAGAFWDAIEAAGGRRLTAGEAVDALAEAITIIREVWAADQRGGVRVSGAHYQVTGAKRGPAPAHPIGIWVGGYQPRMLRLIGAAADGWLPSLSYLPKGVAELADSNVLIDAGAGEAGRDPRSVRRLLNISGEFSSSGTGLLAGPAASGRKSSLAWRWTSASPASSWRATTRKRSSVSARRWRPRCASWSRPSGPIPGRRPRLRSSAPASRPEPAPGLLHRCPPPRAQTAGLAVTGGGTSRPARSGRPPPRAMSTPVAGKRSAAT